MGNCCRKLFSIDKNCLHTCWSLVGSCLNYTAYQATLATHANSAKWSQHSPGAGIYCDAIYAIKTCPLLNYSGQFLCTLFWVMVIHWCHIHNTWNSICYDDSLVITKQSPSFTWHFIVSKLFVLWSRDFSIYLIN